ncbi:condensation domain-containing protein [Tengunoibacter tsumagoiensis]|uniref:Carrier domain-containing protein n=1 Tax=Tengunoibacter tsumagoiensis TaxID=2014871 RepID=A0A402A2Y8_9CHLR|nr:condensation domain-containing protein [Tengunoibacter tsumagoiensis]GCE13513.1 hypothetical protein KTT_33720 [Tengunoibacter tsumagoiensis]
MTEDTLSFPLSLSQEGMWLAIQITPESAAYNIPYLLSLTGPVNKEIFARTLGDIIERHESLRTTFVFQDGEVAQIVSESLPLPYGEHDFRETPDPLAAAHQFALQEARRLFDLATGPLLRVWLLQLADEKYQLLCVFHHLISDGWSMDVFLRELSEIYTAYHQGQPQTLQPLPIHYADFAVWQRERLQGPIRQKLLDHWQQALADAPPLLALASDHPRPSIPSLNGATHILELPHLLAERLIAVAQSEQCTLFMALLAVFQATLFRSTEQTDLIVGSPLANRTLAEVQGQIGLFTNMLPLRTKIEPELSWRQLLKQVRDTTLETYAHQELPFEELVKAIHPIRIPGASPCFQIAFSLQQSDQETLRLPGLLIKTLDLHNNTSKFDLTMNMKLTPEHFSATFIYSTDLFEAPTIQRLADHMQLVLEQILAQPDVQLAALPALVQISSSVQPEPPIERTEQPEENGVPLALQRTLEQMLVEIWQQVLGVSELEVQDNFFDLGGYSLLMIQVQRQLQDLLHVQIALTDLFRSPTVQTMAHFLIHGFPEVPALLQQRERGRARDEALSQQRARRQAQRAQRGARS